MRKPSRPLDPMHHNSTASGIHFQLNGAHFVSFSECFLNSAALAATPEYMPVTLELSGDVTVTLKAAEMPLSQLVTRMSAERVLEQS